MFGVDVAVLFGIVCVLAWALSVGTVILYHVVTGLWSAKRHLLVPPTSGGRRARARTHVTPKNAHAPVVLAPGAMTTRS